MTHKQDAFREEFLRLERIGNEELVYAERINVSSKLMTLIKKKLSHKSPENISIVVYGPPRDGKSYAAISLAAMICQHLNKLTGSKKYPKICRDESEFLEGLKDCHFQDVFLIDEKKETMVQEGSFVEAEQMKDVDNICAAKCLTVIRLKPQEIWGTNAMITLKTHGKDRVNKSTKLLVKVREMNGERWIGHVIMSIKPVLCADRIADVVGACSVCPKFQPYEKGLDTNKQPTNAEYCDHFMADYERAKLENIDAVLEGSAEYRTKILTDIAEEIASMEMFAKLKKKDARCLWVKSIVNDKEKLEHATNRRLTISEINQIVAYAEMLNKMEE